MKINNFIYFIIKYLNLSKLFFLSKNENTFLKNFPKTKKKLISKKFILINATEDYASLLFNFLLKKEKKYSDCEFLLYFPLNAFVKYNIKSSLLIYVFKFYYKNFILYLRNRKWKKLYQVISCNSFSYVNLNIFKEIKYLNIAEKILLKTAIKNKNDLTKIKYKNFSLGRVIYDTYLRYNNKVTINLNDYFLVEILAKSIVILEKLQNRILSKYKISSFLTNQFCYINHGIPVKFFLNSHVKVHNFSWFSGNYISEVKNVLNIFETNKYKKNFIKFNNKKNKLLQAKLYLANKFNGKFITQEYVPFSVYKKSNKKIKNFHGVIFLHCFVDAPASREMFFNDFYDWTIQTLNFFRKIGYAHNIAIKPHPDSKDASLPFIDKLKKDYPEFTWLSSKISNTLIFNKKPYFGVSALGTVLHEMAFHNVKAISAGNHLFSAYNFVITPKNQKQYFNFLLLASKKKLSFHKIKKKEIYEYVYNHYIHENEETSSLIARKIDLKNWNLFKQSSLLKFIKTYSEL